EHLLARIVRRSRAPEPIAARQNRVDARRIAGEMDADEIADGEGIPLRRARFEQDAAWLARPHATTDLDVAQLGVRAHDSAGVNGVGAHAVAAWSIGRLALVIGEHARTPRVMTDRLV